MKSEELQLGAYKCGVRSAERGTASLRYTSLTRIYLSAECGARSEEQPYGVRNAERGTRNGFATLYSANKDLFKCGVRNDERGTALLYYVTQTRIISKTKSKFST